MEKEKKDLLEEAIKLESNMCGLYHFYSENFPEDKDFWLQLAKEEAGHAALLGLAEDFFETFPKEIIYNNLGELKKFNFSIKSTIEQYENKLPPKKEAYMFALKMESCSYELHYQKMVNGTTDSKAIKTFQKLNNGDKDHAERIKALLKNIHS